MMKPTVERRNAAIIRFGDRLYRLSAVGFDARTGHVYLWAWLGDSFEQATWRVRLDAETAREAARTGRVIEGLTASQAERMTVGTRPPAPVGSRPPKRRRTGVPVEAQNDAHALHLDLARDGITDHYAFAADVLGVAVLSFRDLTPAQRQRVRDAAFVLTAR